jgi:hypothetical protein
MAGKTPTVDEFVYVPTGCLYLRTGSYAFENRTPPLAKMLQALPVWAAGAELDLDPVYRKGNAGWWPWVFGDRFMELNAGRYEQLFFLARLVVVAFAAGLGVLVFLWSRAVHGRHGALLSLFLCVLSPNLLAHARLATVDVAATLTLFAFFFVLWRVARRPSWWGVVACGLLLGAALLVKFTAALAVLLAPPLAVVLWRLHGGRPLRPGGAPRRWSTAAAVAAAPLVTAWAAVCAGYGFSGFGTPVGQLPLQSALARNVAGCLPRALPVPLPREFALGLDAKKADAEGGGFPAFLAGRWSKRGFPHYFAAAFVLKAPLAFLGILLWALVRFRWREHAGTAAALFAFPLLLLVVLSFFNRTDYGLRYLLPAFPFLFVVAGSAWPRAPWGRVAVGLAALWFAVSSARVFPHYLAHFNELAGGPSGGHRYLIDSNLDWGQDLKGLARYVERKGIQDLKLAYFGHVSPRVYGMRAALPGRGPQTGWIAVSATLLQGLPYAVTYDTDRIRVFPRNAFAWLRVHRPVAVIGHSIFVYHVSPGATP